MAVWRRKKEHVPIWVSKEALGPQQCRKKVKRDTEKLRDALDGAKWSKFLQVIYSFVSNSNYMSKIFDVKKTLKKNI